MKPFRDLPGPLRLYIAAHLPLLVLAGSLASRPPHPATWSPVSVSVLCVVTAFFSIWNVRLTVFDSKMSLASAAVFLTLILNGVDAAFYSAAIGGIVSTYAIPGERFWQIGFRRREFYRLLFNAANGATSGATGGLVYFAMMHLSLEPASRLVLAVTTGTAVYFLVNTIGISIAIALQNGVGTWKVWTENFLWTAPSFFAASFGAVLVSTAYSRMGLLSLLLLPPVWVVYYSYRLYVDGKRQDTLHIKELNELNQAIIASLATAIDAKDHYTCSHINRVHLYARGLAEAAGVTPSELQAITTGALVHDIGKLGIPDHILRKPGKLTTEEFRRIQHHVHIGAEILAPIPFPFPVVEVVRTHHERWDGRGYPRGLKGEEIPIGGRVIGIVDVFDALTSDRPYRRALSDEEAIRHLKEGAGKQFDPHLVDLFEQILPRIRAELSELEAEARRSQEGAPGLPETGALIQISQAAAEMAAVCDVAHALADKENIEEVAELVAARALSLLPVDTAIFYRRQEELLVAVATAGRYAEKLHGMDVRVGEGVAGYVAAHQQPRVNAPAMLDVARRFTPEENVELNHVTVVPMLQGNVTLGTLAVYTQGYDTLTEHHLNVLNVLAEHAASAMQNTLRVERQREMAYTDPATGLLNSRGLVRNIDRLLFARGGQRTEFTVIMLDLDRFKEVNDTLGHLKGDEVLKAVADALLDLLRPTDLACRYAGDEFVLVLPGTGAADAATVARRVKRAVERVGPIGDGLKVGCSVGAATFPADGEDGRTLLSRADQRMYEDKLHNRRGGAAEPTEARTRAVTG
jgi:diguanylate cyclase (GGDEF)-like protein/putative nucleotidyltransferase with HDIG domain